MKIHVGVSVTCKYQVKPRDAWAMKNEDLERTRDLGKGNFGEVYEGFWRPNGDVNKGLRVAVKELKDRDATDDFKKETNALKKLQHKRIVTLYG